MENTITHREIAPATHDKYNRAADNWLLWVVKYNLEVKLLAYSLLKGENFRGEPGDTDALKGEPVPSPQLLKLFVEDFLVKRKNLPSTKSVCDQFVSFTSYWERATCRTLSNAVKKDVLNLCPSTTARAELISF